MSAFNSAWLSAFSWSAVDTGGGGGALSGKLRDDSNEVITVPGGEALQYTLTEGEPDMLYTDYMPNNNEKLAAPLDIVLDTPVEVVTLNALALPAGTYLYTVSFVVSNPDTNDSLYWSVEGDLPSVVEFAQESADKTDVHPISYTFQADWAGGDFTSTLTVHKEDSGAATITISAAGIYFKRVK